MKKQSIFPPVFLQKATSEASGRIWEILEDAIEKRRLEGSTQWQNGYPNKTVLADDLKKDRGFVLMHQSQIIGYAAIILNDEPAYSRIKGRWLTTGDFYVIHRVAIAKKSLNKGFAKRFFMLIEEKAKQEKVPSIKVDTNYDNEAMLSLLKKLNYCFCGEVSMSGAPRLAFEKTIDFY